MFKYKNLSTVLPLDLEANQNKKNCLVSNFYNNLKFPALFAVQNRWEKTREISICRRKVVVPILNSLQ